MDAADAERSSRTLDRDVAGCAAAHQALLATLDGLTDEQARRPSRLPGWTVGHVVTHLARNADSFVRMIEAAERGEAVAQYASPEARNHDIEAGADRPAAALISDARGSIWRLEGAWATASEIGWAGHGFNAQGQLAIRDLPGRRWVECTVHHADLGLGYEPSEWPAEFVRLELDRLSMRWASRQPMGLTELPPAARRLDDLTRLLWFMGRVEVPDLGPANVY